MSLLQKLVDKIYLLMLGINGKGRIIFKHSSEISSGAIDVVTLQGYDISIFCKQVNYKYQTNGLLIPIVVKRVYKVHGTCSALAPETLKSIINTREYLPRLAPLCISDSLHNRILVSAYLDILIKKIKDIQRT